MLHACVRTFDVTGIVEIFLETKQGLNIKKICNFYICDQLRRSFIQLESNI